MHLCETLLLVHGLWMHGIAMGLMQRRLRVQDYAVSTYSYPTVRVNLAENAERLARYCDALDCDKVHLVAHSMGGIVALRAAGLIAPERLGRIVLIGTPFADCYSGRQLEHLPGGRCLLGNCMAQWLREPRPQLFDRFDIGVIAGDGGFGLGRVIAPGLPKPHDGVIAVRETRVPGMCDHITLSVSHTAMLLSRQVIRQVQAFLKQGHFDRSPQHTG